MATNTPNLNLRKPDDNAAAGGDDLVDVTLDIANNLDILDLQLGDLDSMAQSAHQRLLDVEALTELLVHGTYTPVLTAVTTNPTLGTGSIQEGWYFKIGKFVIGGFFIQFGSAGAAAGSGVYLVSLPFSANINNPMRASNIAGSQNSLGVAQFRDNSVPDFRTGVTLLHDANNVHMRVSDTGAAQITAAIPWTWANDDRFSGTFAYIAA